MSRTNNSVPLRSVSTWWAGVAVLVVWLLLGASSTDLTAIPPDSPFDGTGSGHAEQWLFLDAASSVVPAGSTFTVDAPDRSTEMSLYMISVGLLPHAIAVPATYYGTPVAAAETARFVLAYGGDSEVDGAVHTTRVRGGVVLDRQPESR